MSLPDIKLDEILRIITSTAFIYVVSLLLIRMNGLRSLAKMSSHSFIVTLAIASICASVIVQKQPNYLQGAVAISSLLAAQTIFSLLRFKKKRVLIDNQPVLLMKDGEILNSNLKKTKVTEQDLYSKLRQANIARITDVKAVVFEQTGDISILHGNEEIDPELLNDVKK